MSDEFTLTNEQVENWRTILITLPLPPLMRPLGPFALIMSREMVVKAVNRIQELMNEEKELELQQIMKQPPVRERAIAIYNQIKEEREHPPNIIRTRPRKIKPTVTQDLRIRK